MIDLRLGDCLDVLRTLPDASVDAVVTDPIYPEISRDYGRISEADWHVLMRGVVEQTRRILKPHGSAVFILQPNSERVGRMRPWLWEFMAWTAREWNQVQDAWWWNFTAPPTVHCHRTRGLMRPSVKAAVWLGDPDCYRNQDAVLWEESENSKANRFRDRALRQMPSGYTRRQARTADAAQERGGTTPFNLLPICNADASKSAGAAGHGAGTPLPLCDWWVRYITPPGGTVLDMFCGSGTTGIAAVQRGCSYIGIDKMPENIERSCRRTAAAQSSIREAA